MTAFDEFFTFCQDHDNCSECEYRGLPSIKDCATEWGVQKGKQMANDEWISIMRSVCEKAGIDFDLLISQIDKEEENDTV